MKQGWEEKSIQEITKVVNGYAFASKDFNTTNTIKSVKITNVGVNEFVEEADNYLPEKFKETLKDFQVRKGNIVLALTRTIISAGLKVAVVPESYDGALINQRVAALVPNEKLVNQNFLYYFLTTSSVAKYVLDHVNTLMQPNLSINDLKNLPVPCPPLPEQQRIVSILDEAFAAIARAKANAEQNLKNAAALFESYLQGVFEKKGDGWENRTLGELATFRNGMNFTKSSKGEEINIVGVKDFQNSFWVPFETLETVTLDGKLNDLDLLKEGDILAVRSNGNPQLIGRTLLASQVVGKVSHSGFTIRIRLNNINIDPIYLCNYLKISSTRKLLVDGGNGVGIKSLNQGSLSALIIPFPKSVKAQQAIVQKLNALSAETKRLEAIYQQKLLNLEELKKSVLQKAFNGELTTEKE